MRAEYTESLLTLYCAKSNRYCYNRPQWGIKSTNAGHVTRYEHRRRNTAVITISVTTVMKCLSIMNTSTNTACKLVKGGH